MEQTRWGDQSWNLMEGCKKSNSMIRRGEGSLEFQFLILNIYQRYDVS